MTRDEMAGVPHELHEHVVRFRREVDNRTLAHQPPLGRIKHEFAELVSFALWHRSFKQILTKASGLRCLSLR